MTHWSNRFDVITAKQIRSGLGVSASKYHDWKRRYGRENKHNGQIPRWFWLLPDEREAIIQFYLDHREDGYRRCAYMMIDEDVAYCSPSTVYRVLRQEDLLRRWNRSSSSKGDGFKQPSGPHSHWHTDISYVNIGGTFYYLITVLDGYSRYILAWDIRESMEESDVQIVVQRGHERYPQAHPRVISDNGKQFVARDFRELIRLHGMTHVTTSPYY